MEPSDRASIEVLRPKTVPDNLTAWGTVSQVSDIQLKIQITGGIVCLVDRLHINQAYTKLVQASESKTTTTRKSSEPPKLSQLFQRGQQYVCKILERQTRKGYADAQDIIATLDPSDIQEDNLPATVLSIPNVPLQCAITSIEDHGYHVDIGFKNVIDFLNFEETTAGDNDNAKFLVGQIIRCCTKETLSSESTGSRVVQLSMLKETIKKARFSRDKCGKNILTAKCILPGSSGYSTVMRVQKDGLIVNFLDEFAGFVGLSHLKKDRQEPKMNYKIADILKCTVLYYNPTTNTFCLSLKSKKVLKTTLKSILRDHYVGQVIPDAKVAYINQLKYIEFKLGELRALANVRDAVDQDVSTMTKDELHSALDSTYAEGSLHKSRIKSINYADLTIVLSLRQDFLELPYVSVEELKPADFLKAEVSKHVKDGIIVKFGLNLRAIILNTYLNDSTSTKNRSPALDKRYPLGKTINCRVLKVDFDKQPARVYLTDKERLMEPEMTIIDSYDKSFRGETVNAVVSKLKHDGLIVEMFNNVKGFVPRRFCSTVPIKTVGDLFQVGQVISCTVYRVEPHRQSLLLGIIPYEKIIAMKRENKLAKGERQKLKELNRLDRKFEHASAPATVKSNKRQRDENLLQGDEHKVVEREEQVKKKSRLERSIEAKQREEAVREAERALLHPDRPAQSIADFERLVLKNPNSADAWIKYGTFFLDNVETEKARIVCRRALRTISFRMEREKLKIWLQLIKIEAKYGGKERLREIIEESAQTNDKLQLFLRASKTLVSCDEFDEAEKLHEESIKLGRKLPAVWIEYANFLMEHGKDLDRARSLYERALKSPMTPKDLVYMRSRYAHLEFKYGDVERGKTLFESLLSENPKRKDLWKVYEAAIRKFGTRQLDTDEVREQNELILQRIATLSK